MNDQHLSFYRSLLSELLADLDRQNLRGESGQRTVQLDQQSVGRLSRMDALQQQAMAKATQVRRDQQRSRALAALSRIDEGEFGFCLACGDEISEKRLRLDPTVVKCMSCSTR